MASTVRYVMRHPPADNVLVLCLAAAASLLYAGVAVLARRGLPGLAWMSALVAVWAVLVIAAPSFAWCSFALFFLCRASRSTTSSSRTSILLLSSKANDFARRRLNGQFSWFLLFVAQTR